MKYAAGAFDLGVADVWGQVPVVLQTPTSPHSIPTAPPPTCDNRNVPSQAEATTLTTAALSAGVSKTPAGAEE